MQLPNPIRQIEIVKGQGRQPWYLRVVAGNGETIAVSEGYFSKWNAKRAAKKNFPDVPILEDRGGWRTRA